MEDICLRVIGEMLQRWECIFFWFFFLPGFRSKLALEVHTNTVCVGNRLLMLFT